MHPSGFYLTPGDEYSIATDDNLSSMFIDCKFIGLSEKNFVFKQNDSYITALFKLCKTDDGCFLLALVCEKVYK